MVPFPGQLGSHPLSISEDVGRSGVEHFLSYTREDSLPAGAPINNFFPIGIFRILFPPPTDVPVSQQ